MKKISKAVLGLVVSVSLTSCVYDANFRPYVMAHRAGYDVTRPDYLKYIQEDPRLSDADKATIAGRLSAEDDMITNAEKLLGIKL